MRSNLKHIMIVAATALLVATGCKENERMTFEGASRVYFTQFSDTGADSVVYSFAGRGVTEDTIYLSVGLIGEYLQNGGRMKLVVDTTEGRTTAVENLHYAALPEYYTFPSHTGTYSLPIKLLNTDEKLKTEYRTLSVMLVPTDQLLVGYKDKLRVRILITDQIVKPVYWDMPLALYFGEYSRNKHAVCIQIMGRDFPATEAEIGKNGNPSLQLLMVYGRAACQYCIDNVVLDDNNNRIMPWPVF